MLSIRVTFNGQINSQLIQPFIKQKLATNLSFMSAVKQHLMATFHSGSNWTALTRKRAIAKALQLKGYPTSRQSIWRIIAISVFFVRKYCVFGRFGNFRLATTSHTHGATPLVHISYAPCQD